MNKNTKLRFNTIQGKITFTLLFLIVNFISFSCYVFVENRSIEKIFTNLSVHNEPTITMTFVAISQLRDSKNIFLEDFFIKDTVSIKLFQKSVAVFSDNLMVIKKHCDTLGLDYQSGFDKILAKKQIYEATVLKGYDILDKSKGLFKKDSISKELNTFLINQINPSFVSLYWEVFTHFGVYGTVKEAKAAQVKKIIARVVSVIMLVVPISLGISILIWISISGYLKKSINKIITNITTISTGKLTQEKIETKDEIAEILNVTNILTTNLKKAQDFATQIGDGNFDFVFEPISKDDTLGISLLSMREELKKFKIEDEKRLWINHGFAKFADILRANTDLTKLCEVFLSSLIKYVNANQGTIFVLHEDINNEESLKQVACYAYDRKKYENKNIEKGDGLVGQVLLEKETIYLTDVPDDFIQITSGLGQSLPKAVLIVPLKVENDILGVLELASFQTFEEHQITFINKLGENLASILISVKNNEKNKVLLEQLQEKTEMMQAQEEEMRQNMEEMQATQEELMRNEKRYEV